MIQTRLAHTTDGIIIINPYTISYITSLEGYTTIGLTNGHTYDVTASPQELMEVIENETKSLCKECKASLPTQDDTNRWCTTNVQR